MFRIKRCQNYEKNEWADCYITVEDFNMHVNNTICASE